MPDQAGKQQLQQRLLPLSRFHRLQVKLPQRMIEVYEKDLTRKHGMNSSAHSASLSTLTGPPATRSLYPPVLQSLAMPQIGVTLPVKKYLLAMLENVPSCKPSFLGDQIIGACLSASTPEMCDLLRTKVRDFKGRWAKKAGPSRFTGIYTVADVQRYNNLYCLHLPSDYVPQQDYSSPDELAEALHLESRSEQLTLQPHEALCPLLGDLDRKTVINCVFIVTPAMLYNLLDGLRNFQFESLVTYADYCWALVNTKHTLGSIGFVDMAWRRARRRFTRSYRPFGLVLSPGERIVASRAMIILLTCAAEKLFGLRLRTRLAAMDMGRALLKPAKELLNVEMVLPDYHHVLQLFKHPAPYASDCITDIKDDSKRKACLAALGLQQHSTKGAMGVRAEKRKRTDKDKKRPTTMQPSSWSKSFFVSRFFFFFCVTKKDTV